MAVWRPPVTEGGVVSRWQRGVGVGVKQTVPSELPAQVNLEMREGEEKRFENSIFNE